MRGPADRGEICRADITDAGADGVVNVDGTANLIAAAVARGQRSLALSRR